MKKGLYVLLLSCICFGLTGCGSSSDPKDTQDKIKKAGYSINLDKNVGTVVGEIKLSNKKEDANIILTFSPKKDEKVTSIDYRVTDKNNINISVTYVIDEEKNVGFANYYDEPYCSMYDIDKDEFIDEETYAQFNSNCRTSNKESLKSSLSERDKILKEIDVTLSDLESFGNWYYNK